MKNGLKIDVVNDEQTFLAMAEAWDGLWERSLQAANPFLCHDWFRAWWEAFGEGRTMCVLRLSRDGRFVGIVPLMRYWSRYYGLPVRKLSLITNDHTNRTDFILDRDEAAQVGECVDAVLAFIAAERRRWDFAELDFMVANAPVTAAVVADAHRHGLRHGVKPSYDSPYIPLDQGWDGVSKGLDTKFRSNLRNREKRLAQLGPVECVEGAEPLSPFLDEMFVVGEASWKGAEKTAIGSTPALRKFYARLAELTYPKGRASLHLLRVGGKPVAFHYSLRHANTLHLLKTEFDTAYSQYAPGHQIQKRVVETACADGLGEFDFLGPNMEWKQDWTSRVREHVRLLLFHGGPRSRALECLEFRVKPAMKRSSLVRRFSRRHAASE